MDERLEKHRNQYINSIAEARARGMADLLSWFDTSKSLEESLVRGHWDFSIHILTKKVCQILEKPEEKTALEIGFGGGRILNAAASYFREVIGVDIHAEKETIETLLRKQGKNNFRLIQTAGELFEGISDQSVDFVYSFIVLQHLASYAVFESNLREAYRTLKPGGLAQLYYGTFGKLGLRERLKNIFKSYVEISVPPSACTAYTTLVLSERAVKKLARQIGFRVLDTGGAFKHVPDGYPKAKSTQKYITLLKGRR